MRAKNHQNALPTLAVLGLSLVLLGLLSSCSMGVRTRAFLGGKLHTQVHISEKANANSPVALDLVLVYNKKLLKELLRLSAREWFAKRNQYKRDYPNGEGFDVWEWEWVPGQFVSVQVLPLKAKARAGIIFADYLSPGDHRARLDPHQSITIALHETDFTVQSMK